MKLGEGPHNGLFAVSFLHENPVGKKESHEDRFDYAHSPEV
jgi:hypothetical protein